MKLITGLGNPTKKYRLTRHNAGFLAIDRIAEDLFIKLKKNALVGSLIGEKNIAGEKVILQAPLTFMNLSGTAIAALAKKRKIDSCEIMVICDDVNLDFGKIRIGKSGGSGGHNGLKSTIEHLGTKDFLRLRIGIGGGKIVDGGLSEYVLDEFSKKELGGLDKILDTVSDAVKIYLADGVELTMNRFN